MIERVKLVDFLADFLKCNKYKDYAPNGLQVEGTEVIDRVCSAVSVSEDVIDQAVEFGANLLLVHHGFFWKGESQVLTGIKGKRIAKLFNHGINLCAYHLPLDAHKELGNNAALASLFKVDNVTSHAVNQVDDLLWIGTLQKPYLPLDLRTELSIYFNNNVTYVGPDHKSIKKIGWCSGAAQDFIEDAANLGVEAYISGEISERTYYQAHELNIPYFACGHHATERLGIKNLGEYVANKFNLEHKFIDVLNPI